MRYTGNATSETFKSLAVIESATINSLKFSENVVSLTASTANTTLDLSLGSIFNVTLSANTTFTFTNPPASGISKTAVVFLKNGGSRTMNVANAVYTDGVKPVLSSNVNAVDALSYITIDGGATYYGSFILADLM